MCKRWIGGENITYNYETGDIAQAFVDQWIHCKGHHEVLIKDWYEEVVNGFHFTRSEKVFAAQTFALEYPRTP